MAWASDEIWCVAATDVIHASKACLTRIGLFTKASMYCSSTTSLFCVVCFSIFSFIRRTRSNAFLFRSISLSFFLLFFALKIISFFNDWTLTKSTISFFSKVSIWIKGTSNALSPNSSKLIFVFWNNAIPLSSISCCEDGMFRIKYRFSSSCCSKNSLCFSEACSYIFCSSFTSSNQELPRHSKTLSRKNKRAS